MPTADSLLRPLSDADMTTCPPPSHAGRALSMSVQHVTCCALFLQYVTIRPAVARCSAHAWVRVHNLRSCTSASALTACRLLFTPEAPFEVG